MTDYVEVGVYDAKTTREAEWFDSDFADRIPAEVTIASAEVQIRVVQGEDAAAEAMLASAPTIEGTKIAILVEGGVSGVQYVLRFLATLSNGETKEKEGAFFAR